ncbi:MAG: hypothetical protein M3Q31_09980 [Actinomycetota bacterium]|nr:hypothetical protein [Actinomycetota bacterium]
MAAHETNNATEILDEPWTEEELDALLRRVAGALRTTPDGVVRAYREGTLPDTVVGVDAATAVLLSGRAANGAGIGAE